MASNPIAFQSSSLRPTLSTLSNRRVERLAAVIFMQLVVLKGFEDPTCDAAQRRAKHVGRHPTILSSNRSQNRKVVPVKKRKTETNQCLQSDARQAIAIWVIYLWKQKLAKRSLHVQDLWGIIGPLAKHRVYREWTIWEIPAVLSKLGNA